MTPFEIAALAVFFVGQLADIYTTTRAIRAGGRESNKVVLWAMDTFGEAWPFVKLAVSVGAAYVFWSQGVVWLILVLGIAMLYVARHNLKIAKKRER